MKQPSVTPIFETRRRVLFGIKLWKYQQTLYVLNEDYEVDLITGEKVVIPKGFISDGATIPWYVRFIYNQMGIYFGACVAHDFFYFAKTLGSRLITDIQFLYHMVILGMKKSKAELFYIAVRIGGKKWYNK